MPDPVTPEEPPQQREKSSKPMNRWSMGTFSVIQIVALLALVLAANIISTHYYKRKDLSRGENYSLSKWTSSLLSAEMLQKRDKPVKMIVAFRRSSPFSDRVRKLVEEYSRLSNGKIVMEHFDPVRDVDRAQQIAATYQLDAKKSVINREDIVIIDSREDTTVPATNENSNHIRFVTQDHMLLYENNDGKSARRVMAFQGEDVMTTALLSAIEGKPRHVYFLADKSDFATETEGGPWSILRDNLISQNIIPIPVRMAELKDIPADCSGLIIASPRYDFTEDEMKLLTAYWNRPASNIMVLLRARETPERLRAFLREHGITPRNDTIVTVKGSKATFAVDASFVPGFDSTRDFWNKTTTFDGVSSSLEVRENDEHLINRRIMPIKLIDAAPQYWGETAKNLDNPVFHEVEDIRPPLTIAAAIIRGAATDDRFSEQTSRMIVMSNAAFLDPASLRDENIDFLRTSANWLVGRQELAGTGPQTLGTFRLPILSSQASFINRINLFFFPAAFLLISLFVWNARRA